MSRWDWPRCHCDLPMTCERCRTCPLHCGGSMGAWRGLAYVLRLWWSRTGWGPRQGGFSLEPRWVNAVRNRVRNAAWYWQTRRTP